MTSDGTGTRAGRVVIASTRAASLPYFGAANLAIASRFVSRSTAA
jgi:hypothetical protein